MDVEHYNRTGEVIPVTEPEEYKPPAPVEADTEYRNYPEKIETEGEYLSRKSLKPTKEQLIEDRMTMTNGQIAEKYGAKTSAVSVWVKEYGLQTHKNRAAAGAPIKEAHLDDTNVPNLEEVILAKAQADADELLGDDEQAGDESTTVIIVTDATEELWRLIEQSLSAIRQREVAAVDEGIRHLVDRILGARP